ncbi:MAG TPA: multicopper oxidase domain-containing protein [Thermoanaerobaculia bacterium]|nr:multicopper oxidase domain-containing protein [Thermoanaerobaculia bacterium]
MSDLGRPFGPSSLSPALALVLLLGGSAALAQTTQTPPPVTCPATVPTGEELRDLPELRATDNLLSTTFNVEVRQQCVPIQNPTTQEWTYQSLPLRTYVYKDQKTGQDVYGYPGPTLRIRKQEESKGKLGKATVTPGDRLKILLVNNLAPDTTEHGKCDDACAGTGTDCSTISPLPTGAECAAAAGAGKVLAGCCCVVNQNQVWPECFHGDNTTNLHFHGTHVSPQAPQDYVLLELRPKLPEGTAPPADNHATHARGTVVYGQFQYDIDPPPPTQAEGTHWYHPHKHGSVSLQVANGMPGALLIEGAFDDWLRGYYGGKLVEKTFVLQQVQQTTNLYNDPFAPATTVNGQVSPTVTLQPGEVQRWRFVNATMQVASQVTLTFPEGVKVRQIAMDGVRFSPENYRTQPLLRPSGPLQFDISPGNRADFLVEGPGAEGAFRVTHRLAGQSPVAEGKRRKIQLRDQALLKLEAKRPPAANTVGASTEPALFTLVVAAKDKAAGQSDSKAAGKKKPASKAAYATGFPLAAKWPKMPWYLENLPSSTTIDQDLTFEMTGGPGDPTTKFQINGQQYDPNCANVTTELGTTETWFVQNSSVLAHPFHIHINPFQLVEQGSVVNGQRVPIVKYASPIWQDTIALPVVNDSWDVKAGPIWNNDDAQTKCPAACKNAPGGGGTWNNQWTTTVPNKESVCGCTYTGNGYVLFRHRYLEFTGEYVLHCHFLGHEDRGMMFNVQTVCKEDPTMIGKSRPYPQPECVPGNMIPRAPICGTGSGSTTTSTAHQH